MEIPSLSLLSAAARTTDASDQVALAAMKKMLDASRAEGAALIRLMEQVPSAPSSGHKIDVYA
jgi:hypothetical protein